MPSEFETKDSGKRVEHASGMVRDVTDGKLDYLLALDGPMFMRYVKLMDRGAVKYGKRNWMKANSREEQDRARESLVRHFFQYISGQRDEDHAAAIIFNLNEIEEIELKLNVPKEEPHTSQSIFINECLPRWFRGEDCKHGSPAPTNF